MFEPYTAINIAVLTFLVLTSISVALVKNLLTATIMLSIYSLMMAVMYLVLGAPDVAITEAAIGAGISTLLFLAVLLLTGAEEKPSTHPIIPLVVIVITAAALVYATAGMPVFGDAAAITNKHVASYYLENSSEQIGIPNVVTSVLASYRGYDTMGETFVVFTAGISILLLIGGKKQANLNK